jgi:hypothetical protein
VKNRDFVFPGTGVTPNINYLVSLTIKRKKQHPAPYSLEKANIMPKGKKKNSTPKEIISRNRTRE